MGLWKLSHFLPNIYTPASSLSFFIIIFFKVASSCRALGNGRKSIKQNKAGNCFCEHKFIVEQEDNLILHLSSLVPHHLMENQLQRRRRIVLNGVTLIHPSSFKLSSFTLIQWPCLHYSPLNHYIKLISADCRLNDTNIACRAVDERRQLTPSTRR